MAGTKMKLRTKSVYTLRRDIARRRLAMRSTVSFTPANWMKDQEYEMRISGNTGRVDIGNGSVMEVNLVEERLTDDDYSKLPSANIIERFHGTVEWDGLSLDVVVVRFEGSKYYQAFALGDPRNLNREHENPFVVAAQLAFNSW